VGFFASVIERIYLASGSVTAASEAIGRQLLTAEDPGQRAALWRRRARMRETQQVSVRPTITRLILRELEGELLGRLRVEPRADCSTHAATPTTERLCVRREVHQVSTDAAHLRQRGVCGATRGLATELRGHRE
jgi:hypothetical protein